MGFDLSAVMAAAAPPVEGPRDIESITREILDCKVKAGEAILEIGRCLMEAKAQLPHGEWRDWLEERVEFSERTATRFMLLAREWTNRTALSDLGATKALSLLALSPGEREAFIAEVHMVDGKEKTAAEMSARELEKVLRERDEALSAQRAAEAARDKIAQDMAFANARLEAMNTDAAQADAAIARLDAELADLKNRPIDVAVQATDPAELEAASKAGYENGAAEARKAAEADKAEALQTLRQELDKAREAKKAALGQKAELERQIKEAREAGAAEQKTAQAERDALQNRAAALERQVKAASGKDLATASVCFEAAQENINKVLGVVQKLALAGGAEEHNKLVDALHALFSTLDARVPEKLEVSTS